jgi:hypothetical protein
MNGFVCNVVSSRAHTYDIVNGIKLLTGLAVYPMYSSFEVRLLIASLLSG